MLLKTHLVFKITILIFFIQICICMCFGEETSNSSDPLKYDIYFNSKRSRTASISGQPKKDP